MTAPQSAEIGAPRGEWGWALFLAVSVLVLTWMFMDAATVEPVQTTTTTEAVPDGR